LLPCPLADDRVHDILARPATRLQHVPVDHLGSARAAVTELLGDLLDGHVTVIHDRGEGVAHLVRHPLVVVPDPRLLTYRRERAPNVATVEGPPEAGADHEVVVLPLPSGCQTFRNLDSTVPFEGVDGELGEAKATHTGGSFGASAVA